MFKQFRSRFLWLFGLAIVCMPRVEAQGTAKPTKPLVEINTSAGRMVVALYNETPLHRDNFLKLVREQAYDSLLFHRVVKGFMIQGGDPDSRYAEDRGVVLGKGGVGYTIESEIRPGLIHRKGALAAARQPDQVNPEKRSSGSQFFIVQGGTWTAANLKRLEQRRNSERPDPLQWHYTPEQVKTYGTWGGAPHLDGEYTIFGEVVQGMEVLDAIASLPCDAADRPLTDVRMWMRVIE